jgi:hypothetical protein
VSWGSAFIIQWGKCLILFFGYGLLALFPWLGLVHGLDGFFSGAESSVSFFFGKFFSLYFFLSFFLLFLGNIFFSAPGLCLGVWGFGVY